MLMARGRYMIRGYRAGILAAAIALPNVGYAEEPPANPEQSGEYYTNLEDLGLRRAISELSGSYPAQAEVGAEDNIVGSVYGDLEGGSAGGYVNLGGPSTSTFLAPAPAASEKGLMRSIEFGLDWGPDINITDSGSDARSMGASLTGTQLDRIGVRADVTALLRNGDEPENRGSAWRVSGMLGSTSLSLMKEPGGSVIEIDDADGRMLWDVGVGWSSGAMSLNAGYQSTFSLIETGDDLASIGVLSLGADYSVVPGLSVFGEFNMIDGPLESSEIGFGTVVIVGTGVSF